MVKRILLLISVAVLLSSSTVFADDTMHLTTLPATIADGYYVGFTGGYLNDGKPAYEYVCNDFLPTTYVPGTYSVNVSSFDSLTNVKFRDGSNNPLLTEYMQAAWLLYQMKANPGATGAIQFAIWNIFTQSPPAKNYSDYSAQLKWISDAQTSISGGYSDFDDVRIYSPTDLSNNSQQEFMGIVPIPGAVWLLGTGLVGLVGIRRRFAN